MIFAPPYEPADWPMVCMVVVVCALAVMAFILVESLVLWLLPLRGNVRRRKRRALPLPSPELSAPDVYVTRAGVVLAHWPNGARWPTILQQPNAPECATREPGSPASAPCGDAHGLAGS